MSSNSQNDWDIEDDTEFIGHLTEKPSLPPFHQQEFSESLSDSSVSLFDADLDDALVESDDTEIIKLTAIAKEDVWSQQTQSQSANLFNARQQAKDPFIGMKLGNFVITNKIGQGGFGSVYQAKQIHIQQNLAIKILRTGAQTNQDTIDRFQREARALVRLDHDGVVQFSDFGLLENEGFYLVMEFVKGKNLSECLKENESFSYDRILNIIKQICSVLFYVHKLGIFHRDLKPDNILLVQDPIRGERVKVIDFGIASIEEDGVSITKEGSYLGSPLYMAPEQGKNQQVDERTDLYSLAIVLYQLLVNVLPFQGTSLPGLISQHLFFAPPPLKEQQPGHEWCPTLEQFIQRALAKDPNGRPKNAQYFWQECKQSVYSQMTLEMSDAPHPNEYQYTNSSTSFDKGIENNPPTASIKNKRNRKKSLSGLNVALLTILLLGIIFLLLKFFAS